MVQFLERLYEWLGATDRRVAVIWDGTPWHKAAWVAAKTRDLDMELAPLSGYSPDLNPCGNGCARK